MSEEIAGYGENWESDHQQLAQLEELRRLRRLPGGRCDGRARRGRHRRLDRRTPGAARRSGAARTTSRGVTGWSAGGDDLAAVVAQAPWRPALLKATSWSPEA